MKGWRERKRGKGEEWKGRVMGRGRKASEEGLTERKNEEVKRWGRGEVRKGLKRKGTERWRWKGEESSDGEGEEGLTERRNGEIRERRRIQKKNNEGEKMRLVN